MKILLTGTTGYIGKRLLPVLVDSGHHVICVVRSARRFDWDIVPKEFVQNVDVVEGDFGDIASLASVTRDFDVAYYLIHSMSSTDPDFESQETLSAANFAHLLSQSSAKQVIYLSGIITEDRQLSKHLSSRLNVETILRGSNIPLTTLRAAIIIGSGSASFEIIRDLVEKLPVMIAPKWLRTRCQPIAIRNVLHYLTGVLANTEAFNNTFDIGGPDILTYQEMLQQFAQERSLKRTIIPVALLTPRLSSMWLALITSTSYPLARRLVESLGNEVVAKNDSIKKIVQVDLIPYREALKLAFDKISHKNIVSSWRDSAYSLRLKSPSFDNVRVPQHGVFTDIKKVAITQSLDKVIANIWALGGEGGWRSAQWLWRTRGILDKLFGGVGLGRGRRSESDLKTGDALDFWRVLLADKKKGRLILYAEMKVPGEAWLEFSINTDAGKHVLEQKATFRPLGLWGRMYWYAMLPFHLFIFRHMAQRLSAN